MNFIYWDEVEQENNIHKYTYMQMYVNMIVYIGIHEPQLNSQMKTEMTEVRPKQHHSMLHPCSIKLLLLLLILKKGGNRSPPVSRATVTGRRCSPLDVLLLAMMSHTTLYYNLPPIILSLCNHCPWYLSPFWWMIWSLCHICVPLAVTSQTDNLATRKMLRPWVGGRAR